MQVMKFGGSSVGTPARIRQVIDIVSETNDRHRNLVVVVSAFQGVTDQLIATSRQAATGDRAYQTALRAIKKRHLQAVSELIPQKRREPATEFVTRNLADLSNVLHGLLYTKELTARMLDYIMGFGELLSSFIISEAVNATGRPCHFTDSRSVIKADETFGNGRVQFALTYDTVRAHFRKHRGLHLVPGFIASTTDNDTVTLGRGGSDYSASLYGAALDAKEIEIWTDVDGVMTADPRKVERAFSLSHLSYEEAMEMSHFGAKVIHPPTIRPALEKRIPIRIKNTFNPTNPGTVISEHSGASTYAITGISSIDDIAILRVQGSGLGVAGIGRRIFGALASKRINVFLTTQASSDYSTCVAVTPKEAPIAKQALDEELKHEIRDHLIDEITIEGDLSVVAVVGDGMRKVPGISGRLFKTLGDNGINVVAIAQGSSELNISTVIDKKNVAKALNALHDSFFLSGTKSLNLFIIGTGLIGTALLKQIGKQRQVLRERHNLAIRVQAVANSRRMLFGASHTPAPALKERLMQTGEPMKIGEFIERMKALNLPNSVFVDCTSSDDLVAHYEQVLDASISIVTPNKKANAGPLSRYDTLRGTALKRGARFLYEANVGAGLPIINTMNDLVAGGDTILAVEGVFSGTLSYIFNEFKEGRKFSEIVLEAQAKGYTEPDPRDDLSGADAGRKLLILTREAGDKREPSDVSVQSLIPPAMARLKTVDEFLAKLPSLDAKFEKMRASAAADGKVLRYVAVWDGKVAEVSLKAVPLTHPAAALTGSDAMVALTTENCRTQPMVIKGPGAGAGVTATAVFADIIRIGHTIG